VEIDVSRKATVTDRGACMPRRDKVDIWALSELCTPWCVHVVATLRIAYHIAAIDRRPDSSSRNGMRHFWILERITVGILAADAPPEHLNRRHVDRDDEELSHVAGRRFQRPNAVPGMRRPLKKQASISPGVQRRGYSEIIEFRG